MLFSRNDTSNCRLLGTFVEIGVTFYNIASKNASALIAPQFCTASRIARAMQPSAQAVYVVVYTVGIKRAIRATEFGINAFLIVT